MRLSSALPLASALVLLTTTSCGNLRQLTDLGALTRSLNNPGGPTLPSVNQLLLGDDQAITTSIADARTDLIFLDTFNPPAYASLAALPRGPNGSYLLRPGAYEFVAQSYCLHAGTYGPTGGDGYAYAPLKGPLEEVIQHILQNSVRAPEIPQHDVQELIWALLAHAKIEKLDMRLQLVASRLLTPAEIVTMNRSALDLIPPAVIDRATEALPPLVRQTLEAEERMREMFVSAHATYQELERTAVQLGVAPIGPGSREVASGRWSYHPGGFFIRFLPSGYSTTTEQLLVPEPLTVERDKRGRIRVLADAEGNRVETDYEDSGSLSFPGDTGVKGYGLRAVRVAHPDVVRPELVLVRQLKLKPRGAWVLVGAPGGGGGNVTGSGRYADAKARYERATKEIEDLRRLSKEVGHPEPDASVVGEAVSVAEYTQALAAALGTPSNDEDAETSGPRVLVEQLGHEAWMWSVCRMAGDCRGAEGRMAQGTGGSGTGDAGAAAGTAADGGNGGFDASGDVAAPGNTNKQRLAQSARPAPPEKNRDCNNAQRDRDEAQKMLNAFSDPNILNQAHQNDWDANQYKTAVAKSVFGQGAEEGQQYAPPMDTDPTTCITKVNWSPDEYRRRGWSDINYQADAEHEKVHSTNCRNTGNPMKYNADMTFPDKLSREEQQAYGRKIQVLDDWMAQNCR